MQHWRVLVSAAFKRHVDLMGSIHSRRVITTRRMDVALANAAFIHHDGHNALKHYTALKWLAIGIYRIYTPPLPTKLTGRHIFYPFCIHPVLYLSIVLCFNCELGRKPPRVA